MSVDEADVADSWEEAADSGELDRQLEDMRAARERSAAAAAAAASAGSHERLLVRLQTEEAGRTQYVPAGPQITILKRPERAPNGRPAQSERARQPAKTLQQREADYAEARQRILGSSGVQDSPKEQEKPASVELLRNRAQADSLVRLPRGPDGSPGFQLRR